MSVHVTGNFLGFIFLIHKVLLCVFFFFSLALLQGNRGGIIASVLQKYRLQFGGEKQFQTSAFIRGVEVSRDREHARACVNREPLAALVSGHSPICFQLGDLSLGKTEKLNSPVIPQMPMRGHAPPQTSDVWPASVLGRVRRGDGRAIYLPDGSSGAALRMSLSPSLFLAPAPGAPGVGRLGPSGLQRCYGNLKARRHEPGCRLLHQYGMRGVDDVYKNMKGN